MQQAAGNLLGFFLLKGYLAVSEAEALAEESVCGFTAVSLEFSSVAGAEAASVFNPARVV
jgi:hypothetical protein